MKTKAPQSPINVGLNARSCHSACSFSSFKFAAFAIFLLTILASPAHAVIWDEEYLGTDLQSSPWAAVNSGRMETDPPNTWLQINGTQGSAYVHVDGGTEWDVGASFTVEFGLNIVDQGVDTFAQHAMFGDGSGIWQLQISTTSVQVFASTTVTAPAVIGLNTWHTFRFVVNSGLASVYLDGNSTALISGVGKTALALDTMRLGKYGGAADGDGQWDNVRWNNTTAIPEPSTALLLGAGLFACAILRNRRR